MKYEDLKQKIIDKQTGKNSGIPISNKYPMFKKMMGGGFNPSEQILLLSGTGAGKTRSSIALCVLECLRYMNKNKDKTQARIFINSLELNDLEVYIIVVIAFIKEKLNKVYTREDIIAVKEWGKTNTEFLEDLEKIKPLLNYFSSNVTVVTDCRNVESWYKYCVKVLNELGDIKNGEYFPKNPKLLPLFITDTVNAFTLGAGESKQNIIKKWSSEYSKMYLRNFYKACVINIQQLSKDSQTTQYSSKGERVEEKFTPTAENAKDARDTPDDSNIVMAIMNPAKFNLKKWEGLDISLFKKNVLFFYHLKSNFSEMIDPFAMYVDLNTLEFEEIPDPKKHPNLYKNFIEKKGIVNKNSLLLEGKNKLNTLLWEE